MVVIVVVAANVKTAEGVGGVKGKRGNGSAAEAGERGERRALRWGGASALCGGPTACCNDAGGRREVAVDAAVATVNTGAIGGVEGAVGGGRR